MHTPTTCTLDLLRTYIVALFKYREHFFFFFFCAFSCVACESANYTQEIAELCTLSATVYRTVGIVFGLRYRCACKLTTGADLTVVAR